MKRGYFRLYRLVPLILLIWISCGEEFLEQLPSGTREEKDFYKNITELEQGLIACYGCLRSNAYFEITHWIMGDVGSDDTDAGSFSDDQPEIYDISYSRQISNNNWLLSFWNLCYQIIGRCNQLIDQSSKTVGDTSVIEIITDQARFLRAISYYHLVIAFGDVPLITKFPKPDEINIPRTPTEQIWEQIESDLLDASDLPAASEWYQSGRVTSGAANSLLGKVYLTQKKFFQANSAFFKVVNSREYRLVPDFGFIFRHEGENCVESIFEIQHMNFGTGGPLGTTSAPFRIPADESAGGWGFDCPTSDLLNEFEPGDPRTIYTFIFPGDSFPAPENKIYVAANRFSPTGFNCRKAWIPWIERIGLNWIYWDINYRYMRYAEVLLLYAESLNEVNKPDSALILLNQVRARARNTPITDPQRISCAYDLSYNGELLPDVTTTGKAQLRQAIWHEQRVELAVEGHRRSMLLRNGIFKERIEASKAGTGCLVEPHEFLFPIPQIELELSGGVLSQNPGY